MVPVQVLLAGELDLMPPRRRSELVDFTLTETHVFEFFRDGPFRSCWERQDQYQSRWVH